MQEMAAFLSTYVPPIKSYKTLMLGDKDVSDELKDWLSNLNDGASKVFEDYATYLTVGTLSFIE